MNYQQRIQKSYQLLPAYSFVSGASLVNVIDFANLLIGYQADFQDGRCGESGLNADQTPLQLCITSTADEIQCRLIADPCSNEVVPAQRYKRALQTLPFVHARTRTQTNAALVNGMLEHFLRSDKPMIDLFTRGVFWIGASMEKPGIAVYTDTSPHSVDNAWDRAKAFMGNSRLNTMSAAHIIDRIREYCWLSSIGIEGSTPENSRIKLYARMHTLMSNGSIGRLFPPVNALIQSGCFTTIIGEKGLSFDDVLFNFGFDAVSDKLEDMKIDISGCALQLDAQQLAKKVDRCCAALQLQPIPVNVLFDRFNLAPSFLGVAINTRGEKRLNVYLKASSS